MIIALDAGHGYETPGKRSPDGLKEYIFNRDVARFTKDALTAYEINILEVHDDSCDVPLDDRVRKANEAKAACFISIHANAAGDGRIWHPASGIEVYIHPDAGTVSKRLGKMVLDALIANTKLHNRGLKTANFHVLRKTKMPAVLLECGFMTNKAEVKLLRTDQMKQACGNAIAQAIVSFYKPNKKE